MTTLTHPLIPEDWLGHRIGLRAPRCKHLGEARIERCRLRDDAGFALPAQGASPPLAANPSDRSGTGRDQPLRLVDFRTRQQYRLLPEPRSGPLLRAAFPRRRGLDSPASTREVDDLVAIGAGGALPSVTGGEDTRMRCQPTDVYPYSALVHLTAAVASGTLIADNVVLTAAHCVVNGGWDKNPGYEEIWYENTVIPGMDRNPECDGSDSADDACKLAPFGESTVAMAIVPDDWLVAKGGPSGPGRLYEYEPEDWADDVAVLILDEPIGQQAGFFDYRSFAASQLQNAALLNRGYPSPYKNPKPDGYEPWQLWGDEHYCFVEGLLAAVDGVHRVFLHEADTSGGHSGSPIYQWHVSLDGGWRPQIAGVVSHHAGGKNYARRIVEDDLLVDLAVSIGLALA